MPEKPFPASDAPPPENAETSEDTLLGGRVRLRQPRHGYRVAIDPVLLAAAVDARTGERVLDVGTGVGAAALCLAARIAGAKVDGLEVQPHLAQLARGNAEFNGVENRLRVMTGDLTEPPDGLAPEYDHVMTNPPYLPADHGHPPADPSRLIADRETTADLAVWLEFCLQRTRRGGTLTVIHRADRLDELLAHLRGRIGDTVVFPLWPGAGRDGAKRVIVAGVNGGDGDMAVSPGLVLHEADGRFTDAAQRILRDGGALRLAAP
jgi:tRNA1(Val) A37 N6-methylase TrmN6